VDTLNSVLREEFVGMYENLDLAKFPNAESFKGKKIKPPPEQGDFDIREVLKSEYFFF
jgi:DNA-directed RNA polymerase